MAHDFPSQAEWTPASPYQEKVAFHGVAAAEGDLKDRALTEQGVGGVHYVIFEAQALIHLPQALQPLLGTEVHPQPRLGRADPLLEGWPYMDRDRV